MWGNILAVGPPPAGITQALAADREGPTRWAQPTPREARVPGSRVGVLRRRAAGRRAHAQGGLREGDGEARRHLSGRRRCDDLLRDGADRHAAAERQELREPDQGGQPARSVVCEDAGSPRPGALHHPRLRRAAAGAARAARRRAPTRRSRPTRRTRSTCRRTRSRASATGTSRSKQQQRRRHGRAQGEVARRRAARLRLPDLRLSPVGSRQRGAPKVMETATTARRTSRRRRSDRATCRPRREVASDPTRSPRFPRATRSSAASGRRRRC